MFVNFIMSGALVALVAKGTQDAYLLTNDLKNSFFRSRFTRYTNFSQAPKRLFVTGTVQNSGSCTVTISAQGDLINQVWLEGTNIVSNLAGSIFELYIGGQKVDSQTFDYMADIWQIYLAETYTKCQTINNNVSQSDTNFFPLHFFFCDHENFLPLVALQYHTVEIRITWGSTIANVPNLNIYGNYIYLGTSEREQLVSNPIDLLITQVQKAQGSLSSIDLSVFNHPVKSIYFGFPQPVPYYQVVPSTPPAVATTWTFNDASIYINGTPLLEQMSPSYFHTAQGYYNTKYSIANLNVLLKAPYYTQYYTYNFALDATSFNPTGTCNFSRLDNAKLNITNAATSNPSNYVTTLTAYAVNYNILRIKSGISGILFSN